MTDNSELTRWIAENVMLWKIHEEHGKIYAYDDSSNDGPRVVITGKPASYQTGWSPTESIADAWMVVEKLQEMGWTVTLALRQFEGQARDRNVFHGCRIVDGKMQSFCDRAETPCRAICLAAIAATTEPKK